MVGPRARTQATAWFRSRTSPGAVGQIRRFLSNRIALWALRNSQRRGAGLRLTIGLVLVGLWLALGIGAALNLAPPTFLRPLLSATDFICVVQKGKPCDMQAPMARLSQAALTFFTIATLLFSFWSQLLGAIAHTFRNFGAGHVLIVGDNAEAEALARDVARSNARDRKAAVLVRKNASNAEVDALAADGVALVAGPPADPALLRRAGVAAAEKVVAISDDDAQNVAVAAMAAHARAGATRQPSDILMRLEDRGLRLDLAGRHAFSEISFCSLPDLATRKALVSAVLFERAHSRGQDRVHIVAAGDHPYLFAIAAKAFRLLWARGLEAPRISLFTRDHERTAQQWRRLFPGAAGEAAWAADIRFYSLPNEIPENAWDVFTQPLTADGRSPATAVFVAFDDPTDNLRLAAALARDGARETSPLLYVREAAHGGLGVALASTHGVEVIPFGAPQDVSTAAALLDQSLDKAARLSHERFLETAILARARDRYVAALRRAGGLGREADAPAGDDFTALEQQVAQKRGQGHVDRLRRGLCLTVLREGFTPDAGAPAQAPWSALSETFVTRNRNAADHAIAKLWSLGWRPASRGEHGIAPTYVRSDITLEDCEIEHRRWMADLLLDGWRMGERDDRAFKHHDLIPYSAFAPDRLDSAVEKDRDQWIKAGETATIMFPDGFVRTH